MNRVLELVVDFITADMGYSKVDIEYHAGKDLTRMCEWIKRFDIGFRGGWSENDLEEFNDCLKKLIEIRDVYQKGRAFVENCKKGHKKGYRDFTLKHIKLYMKDPKKAQEVAKEHLEWTKKWKSERTYYRHKKAIKEMGIEIL